MKKVTCYGFQSYKFCSEQVLGEQRKSDVFVFKVYIGHNCNGYG